MASGIPYKQAKLAEAWDAIVIGSGIGGLTAAVLLGVHAGKRVLVLERHYEAGGFTHTFHRPGYEWDVGLHYIGQMQDECDARRAFDHITAGRVQWQSLPDIYDRFIIEGRTFEYAAGLERFREGLRQSFPGRNQGHRPISRSGSGLQPRERPLLCGKGGSGACGGAGW